MVLCFIIEVPQIHSFQNCSHQDGDISFSKKTRLNQFTQYDMKNSNARQYRFRKLDFVSELNCRPYFLLSFIFLSYKFIKKGNSYTDV